MDLFKPRVWSAPEVICLKWSSILFGMVLGACLAGFVLRYVWFFVSATVVLAIKPVAGYLRKQG